jgi:hypothetical protein
MLSQTQTLEQLISFFSKHPHHLALIQEQPSHVEIWEEIFVFFFGEWPADDETRKVPDYWRKGSSDPRWDILLPKNKYGAMAAMTLLLEGLASKSIVLPPCKEAA